jgi:hypothetical protein
MNKNNLSIIRQQFAQCVFTHKVLEKAADRMEKINTKIKWANVIILAFVLTFLILPIKFSKYTFLDDMAIGVTVFEILFIYIQKEFSFESKAKEYKKFALNFLELRDKYKNFIVDIMNNLDEEKIVARRDLLQEQYQIIASLSPQTNYDDYQEAQKALLGKTVSDEEFTWSDKEIDRFLPRELKLSEK